MKKPKQLKTKEKKNKIPSSEKSDMCETCNRYLILKEKCHNKEFCFKQNQKINEGENT